jgi:hypothetical protein
MRVADRRWFWVLVIPAMLYWIFFPTVEALGIFHRTLLGDALIFLNTVLLVGWLKYREHLFRSYDRQGGDRWLFYLLAALSVMWMITAVVERRALDSLNLDRPMVAVLVRAGAAAVLIAYMSLWGRVRTEPVANRY